MNVNTWDVTDTIAALIRADRPIDTGRLTDPRTPLEAGKTMVGSDSHTPAAGSLGMLAVGLGDIEVATAVAGEPVYLRMPHIWGVRLTGELPAWVSYGQGASREHAVIAPRYLGLRAVLAVSFARIHWQNLANFGVLALEFTHADDYQNIEQGGELILEDLRNTLRLGSTVIRIHNSATAARQFR